MQIEYSSKSVEPQTSLLLGGGRRLVWNWLCGRACEYSRNSKYKQYTLICNMKNTYIVQYERWSREIKTASKLAKIYSFPQLITEWVAKAFTKRRWKILQELLLLLRIWKSFICWLSCLSVSEWFWYSRQVFINHNHTLFVLNLFFWAQHLQFLQLLKIKLVPKKLFLVKFRQESGELRKGLLAWDNFFGENCKSLKKGLVNRDLVWQVGGRPASRGYCKICAYIFFPLSLTMADISH